MEDRLVRVINDERTCLKRLEEELKSLDGGTLNRRMRGGKHYFMERLDGKQKGITGDSEKIYRLARKGYLSRKSALCKQRLLVMEHALDGIRKIDGSREDKAYIEKLDMLDMRQIIYSAEEQKWIKNCQSKNPYMREALCYDTNDGIFMRSKSERYIGNFLESKDLIYMYEPQVVIDGRPVYPDFMILCPDGRVVLWEHCGLMNDREYFNKMMKKIYDYREIGYVLHDNLICTYEEDLMNADNLEKIYRRFLIG